MPSVSGFAFRLRFSSLCCGLFPLEPVDRLAGSASDRLGDATFLNLCRLCSSGLVGAAGAAPPCAAFSRARLRPGGPPPVRALPTGIPAPTASQRRELEVSATQSSSLALPGGVPWGGKSILLALMDGPRCGEVAPSSTLFPRPQILGLLCGQAGVSGSWNLV